MLHLFNKVYMTFDDNIDCHNNRYVISAEKAMKCTRVANNLSWYIT